MSTLPPVFVEFLASAAGFRTAAAEVRGEITKVERAGGGTFAKIGTAAAVGFGVAAAAAADLGLKAAHMAGDYQFQMNRLVHAAGELPGNLKMVHDGILQSMKDTGTSMKDATEAMYLIESGGYHGAAGLQVLKAAEQGAAIEGANTGDVARALTGLLNDYHLKASQAADTTSMLVAAVGHGMTTFQEMAVALPQVASQAGQFHLQISEVTAAMATMTMHGVSAANASTYLRQMLGHMEGPSATARAAMKAVGVDANVLGQTLTSGSGHGLYDAIRMVEEGIQSHLTPSGLVAMDVFRKSGGSATAYQKLLANLPPTMVTSMGALMQLTGGVKNFQGFLQLGGPNLATYAKNAREIGHAAADSKGNVEGWSDTQKTFNNTMKRLDAAFSAVFITVGEKLLPILTRAASYLAAHVGPAVATVTGFFHDHRAVIAEIAGIIGTILVTAFHLAVTAIRDVVTVVSDVVGWFQRHMKVTVALATFVGVLTAAFLVQKTVLLASAIATRAMAAAQLLMNTAMDANPVVLVVVAIAALAAGLVYAYEHSKTFRDIVNDIGSVFAWVWHNVLEPVVSFFVHNWKIALGVAVAVVAPFVALPLVIIKYWRQILTWFENLPGVIFGYLKAAGSWLLGIGKAIIVGLWNGIYSIWNTEVRWLVNFGSMVWGFFKDAGSWLFNVGAAIFQGLWNGIKQVWNNMTGWLGSVGGWISHLKGPIEKDAVLLTPHGKAIMNGLHTGLNAGWKDVKSGLQGMSSELGSMQFGSPTAALGVAGAGGGVVNINLTVQGNVTSERDLIQTIQTEMLRAGMRRGQTYQNYKR